MYRHVLVPVDCRPETRRTASELAAFLSPLVPCQITLIAVTSPAMDDEQRHDKVQHARQALQDIGDIFAEIGVYTRRRIIEGVPNGDMAMALASVSSNPKERHDLILLPSHFTRQEEFDLPCTGSLADQICAKVNVPVLVLPTRHNPAQTNSKLFKQ